MTSRRRLATFSVLGLVFLVLLAIYRPFGFSLTRPEHGSPSPTVADQSTNEPLLRDAAVAAPSNVPADPAALSRLFQMRMTCERMAGISRELERQSKDPYSWMNNADTAKALGPEILKGWQDGLTEWEENREPCKKFGASVADGSIYELALRAANAGDGDAATCYIMARWPTPKDPDFKGNAISHTQMGVLPRFISDYRKNARRLLDEGMQRGDWRMVSLLSMAVNDRHGQLIGGLRSFDPPDEEYVNLKLMLLGTRGEKVQEISRQVELALQQVPANRVAAADARAQQMYDKYFANKGPYEWGFGGCR